MNAEAPRTEVRPRQLRVGFKTSIITLFVAIVLFVGLTLVYLSFARISAMTQSAAAAGIRNPSQDRTSLIRIGRVLANRGAS
jgi:hypothetical protein